MREGRRRKGRKGDERGEEKFKKTEVQAQKQREGRGHCGGVNREWMDGREVSE